MNALDDEIMRARRRKALAIADVLWAYGASGASARNLDTDGRHQAEALAHTHKGSDDTWALVAEVLDTWAVTRPESSRATAREEVERANGVEVARQQAGARAVLRDQLGEAIVAEFEAANAARNLVDDDPFDLIPRRR